MTRLILTLTDLERKRKAKAKRSTATSQIALKLLERKNTMVSRHFSLHVYNNNNIAF
jgi:hypothetical protein